MVPGISQRQLMARDGTRIGYQVRDAASGGPAPCVVLANGLGGTHFTFKHIYAALTDYRTICWDYRGLYTSGVPADPTANRLEQQVEDMIEILDREQVTDFVVVGWSMGVQVAIEAFRRHRARVRGVLAINGTSGRALQTVMGSRLVSRTIPALLRLMKSQARLIGRATTVVASSDVLVRAMMRLGLVSKTVDVAVFRAVAAGLAQVDWRIYSDLLARLDEHDADDLLATIDVPVTIVTADRDLITPPATAERMHHAIRGSRLVMIEGGSHYTPVEFPDVIVDELDRLLARVPGWERAGFVAATCTAGAPR